MKKLFLLLIAGITLNCCSNDDDNNTETLPPATQTGAGTFACKVNGQSFIDTSGGYFNCYYQFNNGEYYFGIGGNDDDLNPQNIYILTQKREIAQNETLSFLEIQDGNAYAGCGFSYSPTESYQSYTDAQYTGELTITKLDFTNNIVSGTFWFDIEHPVTGETVQIREGRFDTLFTQ
jgi:hypothetical protein